SAGSRSPARGPRPPRRGRAAGTAPVPCPKPRLGRLDGDVLPADLAANAASLGARVERVATIDELRACPADAKASTETRPFVIHVEVDPLVPRRTAGRGGTSPSPRPRSSILSATPGQGTRRRSGVSGRSSELRPRPP